MLKHASIGTIGVSHYWISGKSVITNWTSRHWRQWRQKMEKMVIHWRQWRSPFAPLAIAIGHHSRHFNGDNGAIKWRCHGQDCHIAILVTMAIQRRQWWSNGSPLSPMDHHCRHYRHWHHCRQWRPFFWWWSWPWRRHLNAPLSPFKWRQWRWGGPLAPLDAFAIGDNGSPFVPFFVAIGANGEISNSLWPFCREFPPAKFISIWRGEDCLSITAQTVIIAQKLSAQRLWKETPFLA